MTTMPPPAVAPAPTIITAPDELTASWANAAVLVMGDPFSGKTSAATAAAIECWEATGKKTRLYVYDDGGYGDLAIGLIKLGVMEVWRVTSRDPDARLKLALGTVPLACAGYWPLERNPLTGISAPGCRLVAPAAIAYELSCAACDVVVAKKPTAQELVPVVLCPKCGAQVTINSLTGSVSRKFALTPGFEDIGLHIHDGLTKMTNWVGDDMNFRAAKNELGGIPGTTQTQESDGLLFGSTGMSGVGFIQNRVSEWVRASLAVPGVVRPPIFTALKKRTLDEGKTGVPVYGPEIVGKAITHIVPSWFGVVAGAECFDGVYTLHLARYQDPVAGIPVLAGTRVAPGQLPASLSDPKGATVENKKAFTKFSIGHVFELLAAAEKKTLETMSARFKNAPGIGSGRLPKEAESAIRASIDPIGQMAAAGPMMPPGAAPGPMPPGVVMPPGAAMPPMPPSPVGPPPGAMVFPPMQPVTLPPAVAASIVAAAQERGLIPPAAPVAAAAPTAPIQGKPSPAAAVVSPPLPPVMLAQKAPAPAPAPAPTQQFFDPTAVAPQTQQPQLGRPPAPRPTAAPVAAPISLPGVPNGTPR